MRVTIYGAGAMAGGIGTRALAGGASVRLVDRERARAQALADRLAAAVPGADVAAGDGVGDADVVVLALPFPAGRVVAAGLGGALDGRVVVDISNPVDFATFDALTVAPGTSAAEEIARAVPAARVVKAFNTTFAATLEAGAVDGRPLDVFLAGDDESAKAVVAELAAAGGLRPLDVGGLHHARELEGFQLLHMALQQQAGWTWSSAVKILP